MKKKFFGLFGKKQSTKQDLSKASENQDPNKKEDSTVILRQFIQSSKLKVSYALLEITSSDLLTYFVQEDPSPEILNLFQCCMSLLAGKVATDMVELNKSNKPLSTNWASCRRMLVHPNFLDKVRGLKDVIFNKEEMALIEKSSPGFNGLPEPLTAISAFLCGLLECEKMYISSVSELSKAS